MKVKQYNLAELCNFVKGTSATLKTAPGPYPLVVTADFRRSSDSWQIEGPAVCIPLVSSTGHGDASLHRVHYQEGRFALANLLVALLPKEQTICSAKYLYHLLMTQKDQLLVPLMLGTANVSLKEKDIAGVEVPLPPLADQQRIVARIEELASQIEEARTLRKQEEQDLRQMLLSAFWRIAKDAPRDIMGNVAPLVRRPVHVQAECSYPELGLRSFGKGTFHKPTLSGLDLGDKRVFSIEPGDLLFSNVFAWEGAIAIAQPEDVNRIGSHRYMSCVVDPKRATAPFLCFYFLTQEGLGLIGSASPGGAGRNRTLGIEALSKISVPVPPLKDQKWFNALLSEVNALKQLHAETAADLDALLPALLDRAFKGEL